MSARIGSVSVGCVFTAVCLTFPMGRAHEEVRHAKTSFSLLKDGSCFSDAKVEKNTQKKKKKKKKKKNDFLKCTKSFT